LIFHYKCGFVEEYFWNLSQSDIIICPSINVKFPKWNEDHVKCWGPPK
jgi:hypothetical protein